MIFLLNMDKDIDRIPKNADTDIIIRIDDFGGKRGVTIREFVRGERYTGFTKAGTRIPVEQFKNFKQAINSIKEDELFEGLSVISSGASGFNADEGNKTLKDEKPSKSATSKGIKPAPKAQEEENSFDYIGEAEI